MYYRFGPTPRIFLDFLKDNDLLCVHKGDYEKLVNNCRHNSLRAMVSGARGFTMDAISQTILLVKCVDVGEHTGSTNAKRELYHTCRLDGFSKPTRDGNAR